MLKKRDLLMPGQLRAHELGVLFEKPLQTRYLLLDIVLLRYCRLDVSYDG